VRNANEITSKTSSNHMLRTVKDSTLAFALSIFFPCGQTGFDRLHVAAVAGATPGADNDVIDDRRCAFESALLVTLGIVVS
jgi:hypothetical protein